MKAKTTRAAVWVVIAALAVSNSLLIYMIYDSRKISEENISHAIAEVAKSIKHSDGRDGVNGVTPIKGIDYFDGKNGRDGKDSVSTNTVEVRTIEKQVPVNGRDGVDGLTPIIRCNAEKNRWEHKYYIDDMWKPLNGEKIKCTVEGEE